MVFSAAVKRAGHGEVAMIDGDPYFCTVAHRGDMRTWI
jgi:hypothetical protein